MRSADAQVKAAHVLWELQLAILQEEERRLLAALEEHSLQGSGSPQDMLERLKMARAQCNEAFQALIACLEQGAVSPGL